MPVDWLKGVDLKAMREDARGHLDEASAAREVAQRSRSQPVIEAQGLQVEGPFPSGEVVFRFFIGADEMGESATVESATVNGWILAEPSWVKRHTDGRLEVTLRGKVAPDVRAALVSGTLDLKVTFADGTRPRSVHAFAVLGIG
jgi:hypothetical protein